MKNGEGQNLGAVEAEYRRNPRLVRTNQILSIVFITLGVVGLVLSLWFAVADFESGVYIICGGAGLAPLVLGVWAFWQWRREKEDQVTIHEHGLVYRRSSGSTVATWDEITGVRMKIIHFQDLTKTTCEYILQKVDGTEFSIAFDNRIMANVDELGKTLEEKLNQRLLPHAMDAFERGLPLPFGPLTVSKEHIEHGDKMLTWRDVERVQVTNGKLQIYAESLQQIWATCPVHQIPNLAILLVLIGRFIGVEEESRMEVTRALSRR
jgi:hypothetical protein